MTPPDTLLNATLQYLAGRPWREVVDLMNGWLEYGRQVADPPATTTRSTPHGEEAHVPVGGSEGVEGTDIHDDNP